MTSINPRPDLQDAVPFRLGYLEDGALVASYALQDIGTDALFDLCREEIVHRVKLGDMAFVARQNRDGSRSRLYFAAEYPNNDLGLRERLTTYFAHAVDGSKTGLCELRANDPQLRIVDWDKGIAEITSLRGTADTSTQKIIDRILEVNGWVKADKSALTLPERRKAVGLASGARIMVSPFLVGDVAPA